MTTILDERSLPPANRVLSQYLQNWLECLEADWSLFEPEQLRKRLDALDQFDARFEDFRAEEFSENVGIHRRTSGIRARMESANAAVYRSIRFDIMRAAPPQTLLRWLQPSVSGNEAATPSPGFGYDNRDEVVSGILQLREPSEPRLHPLPEMVFYQPTPVRHIFHLIKASALSKDDVLVDIGSGLGQVVLLTAVLAGSRSIGIEVEPAYVASAQQCAENLHLKQVRFIREDANQADLSSGTVFYLYSPFTGSILVDVLGKLKKESTSRPIKICALGPCTRALAKERWLKPVALPDPREITVFETCF
jgi:hypothetical protein